MYGGVGFVLTVCRVIHNSVRTLQLSTCIASIGHRCTKPGREGESGARGSSTSTPACPNKAC